MRGLRDLLGFIFKLATIALVVAIGLRYFFVDLYVMPHNGMAPTLVYGDRVLVWRRAKPDMGDIVLCEHPRRPEASVIGRVIAFAGHTVSSSRGQLFVDENRATVEGLGQFRFYDLTRERLFTMQLASMDYGRKHRHEFFVEEGTEFDLSTYSVERGMYLLGDNRTDAYNDSRDFGEVDPATCRGEIFLRLTPAPERGDDFSHGYLQYVH